MAELRIRTDAAKREKEERRMTIYTQEAFKPTVSAKKNEMLFDCDPGGGTRRRGRLEIIYREEIQEYRCY